MTSRHRRDVPRVRPLRARHGRRDRQPPQRRADLHGQGGKALAYALFNLQERGRLFIGHGDDEVYEGMIVGEHSRGNDLVVNPLKAKQLTNIRAAGSDENILLTRRGQSTDVPSM